MVQILLSLMIALVSAETTSTENNEVPTEPSPFNLPYQGNMTCNSAALEDYLKKKDKKDKVKAALKRIDDEEKERRASMAGKSLDMHPPTKFLSCRFHKDNAPKKGVAAQTAAAAEFYVELQKKVEQESKTNLQTSEHLFNCMRKNETTAKAPGCDAARFWVDPETYTHPGFYSGGPNEYFYLNAPPLPDILKAAREHLALSYTGSDPKDLVTLNSKLEVGHNRHKTVPWEPLSDYEKVTLENHLDVNYLEAFKTRVGISEGTFDEMTQTNRTEEKFRTQQGASRNPTQNDVCRWALQKKLNDIVGHARREHSDLYAVIGAKLPIMNYLSSVNPTRSEVLDAARNLRNNGRIELDRIQKIARKNRRAVSKLSEKIPQTSPPFSRIGFSKDGPEQASPRAQKIVENSEELIHYHALVENLLSENPKFCSAALAEVDRVPKAKMTQSLVRSAPLLVAMSLAPPLWAMGLAMGTSLYFEHKDQEELRRVQQAAYSAVANPFYKLREDQKSVDQAKKLLWQGRGLGFVEVGTTGSLSQLSRMAQRHVSKTLFKTDKPQPREKPRDR